MDKYCFFIMVSDFIKMNFKCSEFRNLDIIFFQSMEFDPQQKIQLLPKRPKRVAINKKWRTQTLSCNLYTINFKNNFQNIYQYSFQCDPPLPEQSRQLLIQVVKNAENALKQEIGVFSYKGNMIWGLKKCLNSLLTIPSFIYLTKGQKKKQDHSLCIKIANTFDLARDSFISDFGKKVLQILNVKFKESLRNMDFVQITRNKYYTKSQISQSTENIIKAIQLKILRGFSFTFVPLQQHQLKARLDYSSKFIQQKNFLQLLEDLQQNHGGKDFSKQFIDRSVTAFYGNYKAYKIVEIDYNKNPLSQFCLGNQQRQITYKDYFYEKYNKKITNTKQPLIKVILKIDKKIDQNGHKIQIPTYGYMVPELVKLNGVTQEQMNDHKNMRDALKISRKTPQQININCQQIRQQFCEINKDSVFQIGEQTSIKGYALPQISYETSQLNTSKNSEINVLQKIMKPVKFQENSWMFVYGQQNKDCASKIVQSMKFAQTKLGINLEKPFMLQIADRQITKWMNILKQTLKKKKYCFVVVLLNRYEEKYYSQMKRFFVNQCQIGSQFIKSQTVYQKIKSHKSILPIVSKILLQINVKHGYPLWRIFKQNQYWKNRTVMCCAISIKKSTTNKNKNTLSFVGSSNQDMTEFYCDCKLDIQKHQEGVLKNDIYPIIQAWIKSYLELGQGKLPDSVIVYRQGANQHQTMRECRSQIQIITQALSMSQKGKKQNLPSIVYINVNKQVLNKFYEMQERGKGNKKYENPQPGTVVLQDLSQGNTYDFHLAAQKVNQGTCTPTHFKVLFNNSTISENALIQLTHEQCYNYANWAGSVKVPACLQYVNKLASLMNEHIKQPLNCKQNFKRKLFFL